MNTAAFARLMARHLDVENPSRLGGDAALDVIAAMNAGLQQFYREAPARLKRLPISRTVRAPQSVGITVTAQYSRTLTTNAFAEAQIGCTVQFGLVPDNEVAAANLFLNEHLSSTLTGTARVFSDALPLIAPIEQLLSDIRLYLPGEIRVLTRCGDLWQKRAQHEEGTPRFYQIEDRGVSQESSPAQLLRLWPLPTADCTIRFEAECGAGRVTFPDLATPVELPVPDAITEDILLPLCVAHLTESPLWADKSTIPGKLNTAANVLARKIPLLSHDGGLPNNAVGTPRTY